MTLENLIVGIVIVVIIAILIMFHGEVGALFKGFVRLFIKDMAATPEGARAIYEEKIDQAQEAYNRACESLRRAAGKHESSKKDLENLKERLKKVEKDCEALVKNGNLEAAALKADEREEILADIERCKTLITAYATAETETREVQQKCEENLRKLKKEAKDVVENMKVKKQLTEVYKSVDELASSTATDKLLESIREKNKDLNEEALGSRAVHESRTSTKVAKAEAEAKKLQSNEYLESLKAKYNK